ncbi:hypothetical protein M758_1G088200 [Ceratodon purpureus]|uniref:Secreted protein n=1 Tax=Ceratodon purpureus TaxID=3225 RepID=A0A8T0J5Q7_CERPU|nr:hypothetical protein KC19_1G093300 [Ceratodon purpureus]KAG0629241.1 hypothetical protein M758_1G088200 [Ceratodon purpureus]
MWAVLVLFVVVGRPLGLCFRLARSIEPPLVVGIFCRFEFNCRMFVHFVVDTVVMDRSNEGASL